MKSYNEMAESVLARRDRYAAEKKTAMKKYKNVVSTCVCLVVVGALGLGAWGVFENADRKENTELGGPYGETAETPTIDTVIEPALMPEPMPNSPGMETMGGYEVDYGETVAYYYLPYIKYGETEAVMEADIALPVGVSRRDLTAEEIVALFGGETNLTAHLRWNDYTLYAHAMLHRDGTLWMLCVTGIGEDGERFELEVMPDALPPTCIVYPESVTSNIWEREVSAVSYDGANASTRIVSFMDRDYGYRFTITGADTEGLGERVSRLVRWIIVDGLRFAPAGADPIEPTLPGEEMTTELYDPAEPVPTPDPAPTVTPDPE